MRMLNPPHPGSFIRTEIIEPRPETETDSWDQSAHDWINTDSDCVASGDRNQHDENSDSPCTATVSLEMTSRQ